MSLRGQVLALASVSIACTLGCATSCGASRTPDVRVGTLRVYRVGDAQRANVGDVVSQQGDVVLEGAHVKALVGGTLRPLSERGALLKVITPNGARHEGASLRIGIVVADRFHAPEVQSVGVTSRGPNVRVRVRSVVTIDGNDVTVDRELGATTDERGVYETVRIRSGRRIEGMRLAIRSAWGGSVFIPGVGVPSDESWRQATWMGAVGAQVGVAFSLRAADHRLDVADEEPFDASVHFELHGTERFIERIDILSRPFSVGRAAGTPSAATDSPNLLWIVGVHDGGLASALRHIGWSLGHAYPELSVRVPDRPVGARVEVTAPVQGLDEETEGPPVMIAEARSESFIVPVPGASSRAAAAWTVRATAYGHAPSDEQALSRMLSEPRTHVLLIPRGGSVRIRARDPDGHRIPIRVRIVGARGTPSPVLGPDHSATGAGDAAVALDGDLIADVPPGKYNVLVTHGPEWTIHEQSIEVTDTFRPDVRAQLRHVVNPASWVGCDFHVHAAPSPDSQVSLEDRLASLVAEGIRFAVPTDHNHITDYGPARSSHGAMSDFLTVPGVEITTEEPHFGHFNAFPVMLVPEQPGNGAPAFRGLTPATLFDSLQAIGEDVLVQVNHPRLEGEIGYFDQTQIDLETGASAAGPVTFSPRFDLLEVWNGFDLARPQVFERVFLEWQKLLVLGHRFIATGNSDSHQVRFQWAGYPRTYVETLREGEEGEELAALRGLRQGRVFVTSGPFLRVRVGEAGIGGHVQLPTVGANGRIPLRVHVEVDAAPWMDMSRVEIWYRATRIANVTIARAARRSVSRFNGPINVNLGDATSAELGGALIVLARGEQPMDNFFGRNGIPPIAFSNPIWLEVPQRSSDAGVDGGDPDSAVASNQESAISPAEATR